MRLESASSGRGPRPVRGVPAERFPEGADEPQSPHRAMPAARRHVAGTVDALGESRRPCTEFRSNVTIVTRPTGGEAAGTDCRASAHGFHMILSEIFNATGLALDIIGFFILFVLAYPAVMRRDFVTSDRVGLDGVRGDSGQAERLMVPESAQLIEQRRRQRQTISYWAGGSAVLVGFLLQFVALFVP